ncbi:MAG: capsular biosynthesis protein [Pseudomonadota bacterium]
MKRLVIYMDETPCHNENGQHHGSEGIEPIRQRLITYREAGFLSVLNTFRNVCTHAGNLGKINAQSLPTLVRWLDTHDIPHNEIYVGKPWCSHEGFYVDDTAIRPDEFAHLDYAEIRELLCTADEQSRAYSASNGG